MFIQITPRAATVLIGGSPRSIDASHPNFDEVVDLLKSGHWVEDEILELMDVRAAVTRKSHGRISIIGDDVLFDGKAVSNLLTERLLEALEDADKYFDRLLAFADNYFQNPSFRNREQLWPFLEKGQNPIDDKGRFLAWKLVKDDYTDIHTGTIDNSVGQIVKMPRSAVDDESDRTCSSGLHVCTWHYLSHFGSVRSDTDRVMLVAVNPKDVVAVPRDYDNAKMRVCEYEVIAEVDRANAEHVFDGSVWYDDVA